MDSLPPIPTPVSQRWREFRIRVLPLFFFVLIAFAATILWKEVAVPPMTGVGFVETNSAIVSAPLPGFVTQLNIKRFQQVKAGDQICQLVLQDPKVLDAELAVIRAEIELVRIGMEPVIGLERAKLSYYQLRLDMMKERADQATQNINLRQAEDEFARARELIKDHIIPESAFQQAKTKVDLLTTSIIERSNLLETLQGNLKNFELPDVMHQSVNPIQASIAVEEAKLKRLEAAQNPRPLLAPIDGMISFVYRNSGESLTAGEPIIMISAVQTEQIVAYVRQPLVFQPKVGMAVHVRSRTPHRETGPATVVQVGAQMEPYNTAMLPIPATRPIEWGLPVLVSFPQGLRLVPGELVDIIFDPK